MTLLDDVRALGVGAPLRAGYEASKRFGGHRVVFGAIAKRRAPAPPMRLLWVPDRVPRAVEKLTIERASAIVNGDIEIFGRTMPLGCPPDWAAHLDRDGRWPSEPWWTLDIRSDARAADVKWTWELGRLRHVVVLARGCRLRPDEVRFREGLVAQLSSFLDANPPETGVHWYSNLELALRAWALAQVVSLAERSLPPALVERVSSHLWHIGRHLLVDVPYTVSTMRNNHLLGDGVGMCVVGHVFADHRFGRRLTRVGDVLVRRFLSAGVRADGSFLEDSLSYHRFVLELLAARVSVGGVSVSVTDALRRGGELLARLGALEGPVPQYGDWDEGRALVTAGDAADVRGSALVALSIASGAPDAWRESHDEVAWYVRGTSSIGAPAAVVDGGTVGGGLARAAVGPYLAVTKTAAGHSHNHADAGSTYIAVDGSWVVADPGTGAYNAELERRTYFRTSVSHPVLRVDGNDELEPVRVFRWRHHNRGAAGEPVTLRSGGVVSWCWHDSYHRVDPPATVVRITAVTASGVHVADWTDRPVRGEVSLPLALGVAADPHARTIAVAGRQLSLDVPRDPTAAEGSAEPFDGWFSPTYGDDRAAVRLSWAVDGAPPYLWAVRDQAGPAARVVDGWWTIGDLAIRVRFDAGEFALDVRDGDRTDTRRLTR